ncbi:MAG: PilZ domain-containing protein [Acidobacteria bacterium]|nr:PilZ domain-containing protein [Acidobacteriota bacterium]
MHSRSRVAQDRRNLSRIVTCLDCRFDASGTSREGVVIDLSLKGAYVSSAFLPPGGSRISLTLLSGLLERPLTIEGRVRRWHAGMSGSGKGRFGVEFDHTPVDLAGLIGRLVNNAPLPVKVPKGC